MEKDFDYSKMNFSSKDNSLETNRGVDKLLSKDLLANFKPSEPSNENPIASMD